MESKERGRCIPDAREDSLALENETEMITTAQQSLEGRTCPRYEQDAKDME